MRRLLVIGWLLALPLLTAVRAADWTDEPSIWAAASAVAPHKPRVWLNLGAALAAAGRFDVADAAYARAVVEADTRSPRERAEVDVIVSLNRVRLACRRGLPALADAQLAGLRARYPAVIAEGDHMLDAVGALTSRWPDTFVEFVGEHPCELPW